jgi:hypothetical protein
MSGHVHRNTHYRTTGALIYGPSRIGKTSCLSMPENGCLAKG